MLYRVLLVYVIEGTVPHNQWIHSLLTHSLAVVHSSISVLPQFSHTNILYCAPSVIFWLLTLSIHSFTRPHVLVLIPSFLLSHCWSVDVRLCICCCLHTHTADRLKCKAPSVVMYPCGLNKPNVCLAIEREREAGSRVAPTASYSVHDELIRKIEQDLLQKAAAKTLHLTLKGCFPVKHHYIGHWYQQPQITNALASLELLEV